MTHFTQTELDLATPVIKAYKESLCTAHGIDANELDIDIAQNDGVVILSLDFKPLEIDMIAELEEGDTLISASFALLDDFIQYHDDILDTVDEALEEFSEDDFNVQSLLDELEQLADELSETDEPSTTEDTNDGEYLGNLVEDTVIGLQECVLELVNNFDTTSDVNDNLAIAKTVAILQNTVNEILTSK